MTEYEKVHFLTDAIYKNVLENFNPGVKQMISTGRALQKALHNVTTHAKNYVECIYTLAQSAQVCKGATSEIGAALLQIAEVHKEINTQVIDNIKSFHSDLLIPLETKQENEFKHLQLLHKKYSAGHKFHQSAYVKAQTALKKHKKKNKAKYGFDQKELQYAREVKESFQKLEDYQFQNLKLALLEERTRYCFLLDRINAMVRNYASHHSKAQELFTHRLPEWSELCKSPHILPESSRSVINAFKSQDELYTTADEIPDFERRTSMDYERHPSSSRSGDDSNSFTYGTAQRGVEGGEGMRPPYMANGILNTQENDYSGSLHRGLMVATTQRDCRGQMKALYTHSGVGETQLSFVAGDVIIIIGDRRDGWQYGENIRTHRMGWFPVSFTEAIQDDNAQPQEFRLTAQRVKSLGNLADLRDLNQDYHMGGIHSSGHSDSDSVSMRLRDHRVAGHRERPMSLHTDVMQPGMQIPTKPRLGLTGESEKEDQMWRRGSFGKRQAHSFHPKQPSIPENSVDAAIMSRPLQPFSYNLYNNFVPTPSQRHTLAYATSPVSDIYMGRRHSTIEQLTQRLRSNSLLPGSRHSDHVQEAPVGPAPSLLRPDGATPSAFTKVQEMSFIPPPEEFRDTSEAAERSASNRSHITRLLEEHSGEMMTPRNPHPPTEPPLPPPPPPLPPPNHPPSAGGNHGNHSSPPYQTHPGGHNTLPGGHNTHPAGHYTHPRGHNTHPVDPRAGGHNGHNGACPPLIHSSSSPTIVRHPSGRNLRRPQSTQEGVRTTVCVQGVSQPAQSISNPMYPTRQGLVPQGHSNAHNTDYMTRSEISHMQVVPPTAYNNSAASPANSSSGYSSGTTQTGSTSSHNQQPGCNHGDLPPPPPPHVPYATVPTQSPPPPPPIPPPNPGMEHRSQ